MKIGMFLPFNPDQRWTLARQVGVTHAIVKLAPELTGWKSPADSIDVLAEAKRRFNEAGFILEALEGDELDMSRIKLGQDGRDEDIERYQAPDKYVKGQSYWFFKYFPEDTFVDVIDIMTNSVVSFF